MSKMDELNVTEEEAQLYDRQIRLWGLEAQSRLKKSKILIIGVTGASCEIIKNLVLAGVNTIGLCDNENVSELDVTTNFLLPRERVGENRAFAALMRTQRLNPRVAVNCLCEWKEAVAEYDVVVAATYRVSWTTINEVTRANNSIFIGVSSFGWYGVAFLDLLKHEYLRDDLSQPKKSDESAIIDPVLVPETKIFCLLEEVFKIDWTQPARKKMVRKLPKSQFLMLESRKMAEELGRDILIQDIPSLRNRWTKFATRNELPLHSLMDADFEACVGPGLVTVNAVLGGLVTQEIIKAISKKNAPVGNFVFFDGTTCAGDSAFLDGNSNLQ